MKWSSHGYWLKSKTYLARAVEAGRHNEERALWRSLSLEHLLRSALTHVHPALNADPQNEGNNLLYAFGFNVQGEPRSIPVHSVTSRLEKIIEPFKKPEREFCDFFLMKRNEEMHTADVPFATMAEAEWSPRYYEVCKILNEFIGHTLEEYFGPEEAASAGQVIQARQSAKLGDVKKRIARHEAAFVSLSDQAREALATAQSAAASGWLDEHLTGTKCPACGSVSRLTGTLERTSEPIYKEGAFMVEKVFLANTLVCGACALHLRDIEEVLLAGVQPHFSALVHTDLHEFYEPDEDHFYMNM